MFLFWLQQSCCILTCITEPGHCKFSWLPKAFTFHCHLLCKGVSLSSVTFPPRRGDVASQPGKVPQCPQGHSPLLDQHLLREAPQPQTHLCPSSWNCLKAFLKTFLWDTMAMRTAPEEFNAIFFPKIPNIHIQTRTKWFSTPTSLHLLPLVSTFPSLRSVSFLWVSPANQGFFLCSQSWEGWGVEGVHFRL